MLSFGQLFYSTISVSYFIIVSIVNIFNERVRLYRLCIYVCTTKWDLSIWEKIASVFVVWRPQQTIIMNNLYHFIVLIGCIFIFCFLIFRSFHLVSGLLIVYNPKLHSQCVLFRHDFCLLMRSPILVGNFWGDFFSPFSVVVVDINWLNGNEGNCATNKQKIIMKQMKS